MELILSLTILRRTLQVFFQFLQVDKPNGRKLPSIPVDTSSPIISNKVSLGALHSILISGNFPKGVFSFQGTFLSRGIKEVILGNFRRVIKMIFSFQNVCYRRVDITSFLELFFV